MRVRAVCAAGTSLTHLLQQEGLQVQQVLEQEPELLLVGIGREQRVMTKEHAMEFAILDVGETAAPTSVRRWKQIYIITIP